LKNSGNPFDEPFDLVEVVSVDEGVGDGEREGMEEGAGEGSEDGVVLFVFFLF
jgi:hypothetical protein